MGELDRAARDLSHLREVDIRDCHRHVGAGARLLADRDVIDRNRPAGGWSSLAAATRGFDRPVRSRFRRVRLSKRIDQPRQHHGEAQGKRGTKCDANIWLLFSSNEAMRFAVARQAFPEHKEGNGHHHNPEEECQHSMSPQLTLAGAGHHPTAECLRSPRAIANTGMTSSRMFKARSSEAYSAILSSAARRTRSFPNPSSTPGRFRAFLANADEPLRGAQDVCAGAPRGRGPMSGQQLACLLEQAA